MFSLNRPQPTQKPATTASGLFGAMQGQAQQQQQQQASQNQQGPNNNNDPGASQINGATSQSAYFDSLLEKSRKRKEGTEGDVNFGELPSLQLGLGDISQRVRELGGAGGASQRGRAVDGKA